MKILYEDNHLLALEKPPGLLTQPSPDESDSLETGAKAYIKERDHKSGNVFLHAIHRLDRAVGGIVLFAKTQKALSRLNAAMREKNTVKRYRAKIEGRLKPPSGVLEHHLVKEAHRAREGKEGKLCRLHYNMLEDNFVEIFLETGRYHQIRAQLAAAGCPIAGDRKYGSQTDWEQGGIALHHDLLIIPHPITKEPLTIRSFPQGFGGEGESSASLGPAPKTLQEHGLNPNRSPEHPDAPQSSLP